MTEATPGAPVPTPGPAPEPISAPVPGPVAGPVPGPVPVSVPAGRRSARPLPPPAYHLLHLGGWPGWWRPLVGMIVALVLTIVVVPVLWLFPFTVWYAVTGTDVVDAISALADVENPTPASLAYLNLTLASMIPIAWLVQRLFHGLKPRWLASVRPRLRWRFLLACLGVAVVALIATLLVGMLVPASADASVETGSLNPWTPEVRDYLLVILFLTPFQAAGEEYLFRGYLTQAFGGLFRSKAMAVLAPALLFALAHGAQSLPVFIDRFAFGLVAGLLVVLTGGLEAGIAMHVLNNFLAFGFALAFSDMGSALNPSGGSWWSLPSTLTQSLTYLVGAVWVARRMGLATVADLTVLAASRGLVYRSPSAVPEPSQPSAQQ